MPHLCGISNDENTNFLDNLVKNIAIILPCDYNK